METEYFFLIEENLDVQLNREDKFLCIPHEFKKCADHPKLRETYEAASNCYYERLFGLESGQFFLDFATPEEYVVGEHARFSITLYLILNEPLFYSPTFGPMPSSRTDLPLLAEEPEEMEEGNDLLQRLLLEEEEGL